MSKRCPEGHLSETEDWCDDCGGRIAGAAAAEGSEGSAEGAKAGAAVEFASHLVGGPPVGGLPVGGSSCPVCSTARVGDEKYCEVCGYDFVTGTGPAPAQAVPLRPPGPPAQPAPMLPPPPSAPMSPAPMSPASPQPLRASPVRVPSGWSAEIVADRAFYDRGVEEDDVPFPTTVVTRVVELGGTRSLIGRQSRSRGYFPEIDLSAVPEDRGVSRTHAMLDHPADGSLSITDLGSSNGTWLDDSERPLERGVAVELHDGARIYLGSWTRITVRWR